MGRDDAGTDKKAMPPPALEGGDLAAAQEALGHRPSISIRARIVLGFLSFVALSVAASAASWVIVSRVQSKLRFLDACGNYAFEIQQARRYEKNFFLYGTNLADALENIQAARQLLGRESADIVAVVGPGPFNTMVGHVGRYEELLKRLIGPQGKGSGRSAIELELREHGAQMVSVAMELLLRERRRVERMLGVSRQVPLVFILALLVLVGFTTRFLTRQMLEPLNRFVSYTDRIARGDFTPITPAKRYRDEFSNLAMAINLMLDKLKKHEEQLLQSRKMAAVGNLTSGIAHELNNPLNNISLTAESLLDGFADMSPDERRQLLQDILTQTERASGTVRNLLDFARMERPSFVPLSIGEIVATTLRLVMNEIELNNVVLARKLDDGLPPVLGDFSQLQQVFLNLFLNAIQAMPRGGRLEVRAVPEEGMLRVDVADTGQGIPESNIPFIFDPFFTTKEQGKGTGLGLSVSFNIIKKHEGRITVRSRLNEGTTFSVFLPLAS
ncbi:MAG: HAMP domain-containing histidine kinase [Elusimicrobia bacterium]|nr:HAMP domain-containing histidine kinase [Elusimicrobiota bacterium]